MKPRNYRDSGADRTASVDLHSIRERGMHAANARPPPAVPYRRYPSLSDDGQPYFPRLRRARRNADENAGVVNPAKETVFSVRVFAFLAIVAIVAALVASA